MAGRRRTALLLAGMLAGYAPAAPSAGAGAADPPHASGVATRQDLSARFVALIGPRVQHDPPYLGVPETNFSCLRSFIDRRTGETAHQLYVAASYEEKRDWDAAHDGAGQKLRFIPISRFEIACTGKDKCSYAEEFAAAIPESELRSNPNGFAVTFTDPAGGSDTIAVSAAQIAAQLAAVAAQKRGAALPTADRAPQSQAHKP